MSAFISLEGQRFGKLQVLSEHKKKVSSGRVRTYWKCLCDCGNETWGQVNMLQNGHKKSCGCLWNSSLPEGEADLRARFRSYKTGAHNRTLIFDLTIGQFKVIAEQNCHYCGSEPINTKTRECFNGSAKINGIDRIDSSIGYKISNCLPCCSTCNRAKGELTYDSFVSMCRKVTNNVNTRENSSE